MKIDKKTRKKNTLPQRGKSYVRESAELASQIEDVANALGLTKNAIYTLGLVLMLARLKPVLAMSATVDRVRLGEVLRAELEQAFPAR